MKPLVENGRRLTAQEAAEIGLHVEWRPCNFGGNRPYVICPLCAQGRLHLYGYAGRWACRVCFGMAYASQREGRDDRARRQARKIRRRLGASQNLFERVLFKPKHMKQTTFDRLRLRALEYERASMGASIALLKKLTGGRFRE